MNVRLILAAVLALLVAACSSGSTGSPTPTTVSGPSASAAGTGTPSVGATREIAVTATDALRFEPAAFQVAAGETVRFVVTNSGKTRHEFFVGDEAAQQAHEAEMKAGGMAHDEATGVSVEPGQTKTLEMTFAEGGETLVGCHEPGHYEGGMKGAITIEG